MSSNERTIATPTAAATLSASDRVPPSPVIRAATTSPTNVVKTGNRIFSRLRMSRPLAVKGKSSGSVAAMSSTTGRISSSAVK